MKILHWLAKNVVVTIFEVLNDIYVLEIIVELIINTHTKSVFIVYGMISCATDN